MQFVKTTYGILEDRLRKKVVEALNDFDMIKDQDRICVALSGGKDSAVLLYLLKKIREKSPLTFHLLPLLIDQKQPGFSVSNFYTWVERVGYQLEIIHEDTYSIVKEKTAVGKSFCGLCSRLRRGILYTHARQQNIQKIALGHHRDDLNETLLLNLFYSGRIASMPPKLISDDGSNVVIRPLAYCAEDDIAELAQCLEVPIIPCNLCGSQSGLKRNEVKNLLSKMAKTNPQVSAHLLAAQSHVKPSQLLDRSLWDFNQRMPDQHDEL